MKQDIRSELILTRKLPIEKTAILTRARENIIGSSNLLCHCRKRAYLCNIEFGFFGTISTGFKAYTVKNFNVYLKTYNISDLKGKRKMSPPKKIRVEAPRLT